MTTINPRAPEVFALLASKRVMTTSEVARLTRISEDDVRRLVREEVLDRDGPANAAVMGYRIPTASVFEFLKRRYDADRAWAEVTTT